MFDKTGTLTCGKLEVSDAVPAESDVEGTELLRLAAGAELRSEHPLGKAIVRCAESRGIEPPEATAFSMSPGKGVSARIDGKDVLCASESHVRGRRIPVPPAFEETLTAFREDGKAVVLVVRDGILIGAIALSDALRNAAPAAVVQLKRLGAGVSLLTGDHAKTARRFAALAGIGDDDVKAELLPDEKVAEIRRMRDRGEVVCMVGDGVNDAPSLKMADVGVAMGGMGSDIALEAADIALMGDDVSRIPYLKRLANATVSTIKFNIILSMAINFVAIALSTAGVLNPVTGALVHNAGSVLVVLNAALLYDRRLE